MKDIIYKVLLYICATLISIVYCEMKQITEWEYLIPFFILCLILYDWATLRTKFVNRYNDD